MNGVVSAAKNTCLLQLNLILELSRCWLELLALANQQQDQPSTLMELLSPQEQFRASEADCSAVRCMVTLSKQLRLADPL